MNSKVKGFLKNNFQKPYFEILEEDGQFKFYLKKAIPLAKHFLVLEFRKNGQRITKEIKNSKTSIKIEELESLGDMGKIYAYLKIKSMGKDLKFFCPFHKGNEDKFLIDKEKSLLINTFKIKGSALGFEITNNFDELLSKYKKNELKNHSYDDYLNEKIEEFDESSMNLYKVYGEDISELYYEKPKEEKDYEYKLSSIVLVYNGGKYLRPCLDSLVNQTLDGLEIILINDKSTDYSLDICKEYASKYENIKIIDKQDNHGLATSANMGIKIARGEYVILVDNDDIVPKDAYEKLYNKAKETDSDISIGSANLLVDDWQEEMNDYERNVWDREMVLSPDEYEKIFNDAFYWNKIIKKNLLMDKDIFLSKEIKVYADRKFAHEAYCHARKISIIPDCVYLWRRVGDEEEESLSMKRKEAWNYIDRINSYENNLDFFTAHYENYFKSLMRRVIIPIEGILMNEEFEKVYFERGASLLKKECSKLDNLYENKLNNLENLYIYLSIHEHKKELEELIRNKSKYRNIVNENGKSYWNMPLFRNESLNIPDELFEIKSLMTNFISIDKMIIDEEHIIFENIEVPKYLNVEYVEIILEGKADINQRLEDNSKTYMLKESGEENRFNLMIPIDDLMELKIYDAYIKASYHSKGSNKLKINKTCIKNIENKNNGIRLYPMKNNNISFLIEN